MENVCPIEEKKPCGKQRNGLQHENGFIAKKINANEDWHLKGNFIF
jgi:hypothetical protein